MTTMEDWKECRIGDICQTNLVQYKENQGWSDFLYLDTSNITENQIAELQGFNNFKDLPSRARRIVENDDIIYSTVRPNLKHYGIIKNKPDNLLVSTGFCVITANKTKVHPDFLYYILSQKEKVDYLHGIAEQAVSTYPSIKASDIEGLIITLPPLSEQKKIAGILSALDEKIETNRKINARLEEMAQAIFKSWFIDFTPFGGQSPQDWERGTLSDHLIKKQNTIKASDVGDLPYLPIDSIPMKHLGIEQYDKSENAKSSLISFSKNDILIGAMRVYFHRVIIAPFDGVTRTTCFVLQPKRPESLPYLLLLCNQPETIDYANKTSKGTTMPYAIWENGLANLEIIMPSQEVLEKFYNVSMPIISKIRDAYKESGRLAEIRDTLLPKLMSGEIKL